MLGYPYIPQPFVHPALTLVEHVKTPKMTKKHAYPEICPRMRCSTVVCSSKLRGLFPQP